MPNSLIEVTARLGIVKGLQQALEQGQNRLRYALELKEKVILNTEQSGVAKIQEDSDSLKQEFDKLTADVQVRLLILNKLLLNLNYYPVYGFTSSLMQSYNIFIFR